MALIVADRVKETTTTTGTGTVTLAGAPTGYQTFASRLSNGDTTYYAIVDNATGAWEVGLGTFTSAGTLLARTTVLESSNADGLVNFAAGDKDVFITYAADKSVYMDASGNVVLTGTLESTNIGIGTAATTTESLKAWSDGLSVNDKRFTLGGDLSAVSNFLSTDAVLFVQNAGAGDSGIHMRSDISDWSIRCTDSGELLFEDDAALKLSLNSTDADFQANNISTSGNVNAADFNATGVLRFDSNPFIQGFTSGSIYYDTNTAGQNHRFRINGTDFFTLNVTTDEAVCAGSANINGTLTVDDSTLTTDGVFGLEAVSATVPRITFDTFAGLNYDRSAGKYTLSASAANILDMSSTAIDAYAINFRTGGSFQADTAGGGLAFGTSVVAANTLDDYEEGNWYVPTLSGTTSGTWTTGTGNRYLQYTKIGNMVHIHGRLRITSSASPVGRVRMNLPFTVASATDTGDVSWMPVWLWQNGFTVSGRILFSPSVGFARGDYYFSTTAGGLSNLDSTYLDADFYIQINGSYTTSE